jgi:hypothetical protein
MPQKVPMAQCGYSVGTQQQTHVPFTVTEAIQEGYYAIHAGQFQHNEQDSGTCST